MGEQMINLESDGQNKQESMNSKSCIRQGPALRIVKDCHYKVAILLESPLILAVVRGFYRVALHFLDTAPQCSYGGRNDN
ncbi:hypothetical protein G4B88_002897, partial [Cannabis sativa]